MALVPESAADWRRTASDLARRLRGRRLLVLTGAGISTESGIPDYRGEETARRARNPIRFAEFVSDERGRRRYWARSMLGWPRFRSARPNPAHLSLATLERAGSAIALLTQNVDRLHHRAGSSNIVELHGALAEVRCLACGEREERDAVQERLLEKNPSFGLEHDGEAPDGDVDLADERLAGFEPVGCRVCGGVIKPDVVFFGENVPKDRVERAYALLDECDALLVVGSSLAVFSGYRFPHRAAREGKPVHIVNVGTTRADPFATTLVPGVAGDVLPFVAQLLLGTSE